MLAATGLLAALMLASSAAAEEQENPRPLDPRLFEAVFVVEGGGTRGLGFLIDSSGLVMTDALFVRDAEYAIVEVDPQRRFVAQALVRSETGVTVLRVNPKVVAGITPLPLASKTVDRPRRGATIVAVAHRPDDAGLSLVRGVVSKFRLPYIRHNARLTAMDFGGPLMNTDGVVVGVSRAERGRPTDLSSAAPVLWFRGYLKQARDRAIDLPLPSARALSAVAEGIQGTKDAVVALSLDLDPADYRIRSGKKSLEFLTPRLLHSLEQRADFRVIAGETPWGWVQHAGVRDPIVVVQVVSDLRWTGGSYFRVAARLVSYPVMVVAQVFMFFVAAFGGAREGPVLPAEMWKPAHAAYHFKGDFLEARLSRDDVEVRPIEGQRHCGTSEVQLARSPGQKPRSRKIRGCWGSYIYPAEAFAPGGGLEIHLFEEGQEDRPEVVTLPREMQERLWADVAPTSGDPKDGHVQRRSPTYPQ